MWRLALRPRCVGGWCCWAWHAGAGAGACVARVLGGVLAGGESAAWIGVCVARVGFCVGLAGAARPLFCLAVVVGVAARALVRAAVARLAANMPMPEYKGNDCGFRVLRYASF